MTVARVDSSTSGNNPQAGTMRKNGLSIAALIVEDQSTLSKIVQDESGKHQGEPGDPDREAAKMTYISVERFPACDGERDGPQNDEAGGRSGDKDADCVRRVQRREHARCL